jgi:hypothetical protein
MRHHHLGNRPLEIIELIYRVQHRAGKYAGNCQLEINKALLRRADIAGRPVFFGLLKPQGNAVTYEQPKNPAFPSGNNSLHAVK